MRELDYALRYMLVVVVELSVRLLQSSKPR